MKIKSYKQFCHFKCYKTKPNYEKDGILYWFQFGPKTMFDVTLSQEEYDKYMEQQRKDQIKWKIEHICKEEID